jgi:DNA-binding GntR family transcriptional regulator
LVRHLDAQEIRDIFNVRAALESLAARELCALPDRAYAAAVLPKAITEMERRAGANLEDRIEADLTFHRTMCQLTGNETLVHSWTSLEGSIRMSIMFAGSTGPSKTSTPNPRNSSTRSTPVTPTRRRPPYVITWPAQHTFS